MAIWYSSEIEVDGLCVGIVYVSKFVERFESGFATDWSEGYVFKDGVLVIDITILVGWQWWSATKICCSEFNRSV